VRPHRGRRARTPALAATQIAILRLENGEPILQSEIAIVIRIATRMMEQEADRPKTDMARTISLAKAPSTPRD
jgi:hypothetical protein